MGTKTLSEQIVEMQAAVVENKDKLVEATKALETDPSDANEGAVVELTASLEKAAARLDSLQKAEKALGLGASTDANAAAPAAIKRLSKDKDTDNLYGKLALCTYESRIKGVPIDAIAALRFKGEEALVDVIKAAQNPAMTTVPAYAGELLTMAFDQLLGELRTAAILPRCIPLMKQHSFGGFASIHVPYRAGSDVDAAGGWHAEGAPIPVKGLTFKGRTLTPKNLGVILTATEEMLTRSSVDLASYFQSAIVADTADYLDYTFIDNVGGSAVRPAGIRYGLDASESRPATGTGTTADIVTDLKAELIAMANAKMGSPSTRWLMAPNNWYAVSMALTATGALQFPETANGMLAGFPVIVSQKFPTTEVLLVDFNEMTMGLGSPRFLASNVATLHEENTTPLPIVDGAGAVAQPVRSLFQTNSWALRMMIDADWEKLRDVGLVQQLTGVSWD